MPRYDFRCTDCGQEFEYSCAVVEYPAAMTCPECGEAAERTYTASIGITGGIHDQSYHSDTRGLSRRRARLS